MKLTKTKTVSNDLIYRIFNALIIIPVISFVIYSCDTGSAGIETSDVSIGKSVKDSAMVVKKEKPKPELVINYHLDSIMTKTKLDSFHTKYSTDEKKLIFALNRMDARRLNEGDVIVIPDTLIGNFLDYSPFPKTLPMLDSIPQTVLISQRIQGIALYENSELVRWGPISSGKQSTPTPNGLHYGNYKAREKISTINSSWLMPYYFNFMNFEGVGVHEYAMPGYPASHACVRLRREDAVYIFDWAKQWELTQNGQDIKRNGTPFMVFGKYDYNRPLPWLNMSEDPKSNFLSSEEMDTLKNYVDRYYQDEKNFDSPESPENKLEMPAVQELETIQ